MDRGGGGAALSDPAGGLPRPTSSAWRLLVTEPLDGAANMAIDEALLRARIANVAAPTLRFFAWSPPAVSLGYAQALDAGIDVGWCRRAGVGLVRRPTGGSAILHEGPEREVTYSVAARAGDFPGADDLLETYRVLSEALATGLRALGVPADAVPLARARRGHAPTFCFARTGAYEIAVGGRKLVGSAQRRQAGAFLQHGSLLLDAEPGRVRAAFPGPDDPLEGVTTVAAILDRPVGFDEAVGALAGGVRAVLGVELAPGELSPAESRLAERLLGEKYRTEAWTARAETTIPPGALLRPAS